MRFSFKARAADSDGLLAESNNIRSVLLWL